MPRQFVRGTFNDDDLVHSTGDHAWHKMNNQILAMSQSSGIQAKDCEVYGLEEIMKVDQQINALMRADHNDVYAARGDKRMLTALSKDELGEVHATLKNIVKGNAHEHQSDVIKELCVHTNHAMAHHLNAEGLRTLKADNTTMPLMPKTLTKALSLSGELVQSLSHKARHGLEERVRGKRIVCADCHLG